MPDRPSSKAKVLANLEKMTGMKHVQLKRASSKNEYDNWGQEARSLNRAALYRETEPHGACFLRPNASNPSKSKYPFCSQHGVVKEVGVHAAATRARLVHAKNPSNTDALKVQRKAEKMLDIIRGEDEERRNRRRTHHSRKAKSAAMKKMRAMVM